jgi:hypothetical protein
MPVISMWLTANGLSWAWRETGGFGLGCLTVGGSGSGGGCCIGLGLGRCGRRIAVPVVSVRLAAYRLGWAGWESLGGRVQVGLCRCCWGVAVPE